MIRGLYSAASGMINLLEANDNIANNLANINTPGFKQGISLFKNFAPLLIDKISANGNEKNVSGGTIGSIAAGSKLDAIAIDFSQGQIKQTDNMYDLALQGDGFFEVKTTSGKIAYTRDGSFQRDAQGYLVTRDGHKLMGVDNKPIKIPENVLNFRVTPDGTVLNDDEAVGTEQVTGEFANRPIAKIKLVDFEDKYALMRLGNNLYMDSGKAMPKAATGCRVIQKAIEMSNANVIKTMTKSIEGMRTYETLAKIVSITGRNLEKTVNQLGKV